MTHERRIYLKIREKLVNMITIVHKDVSETKIIIFFDNFRID